MNNLIRKCPVGNCGHKQFVIGISPRYERVCCNNHWFHTCTVHSIQQEGRNPKGNYANCSCNNNNLIKEVTNEAKS